MHAMVVRQYGLPEFFEWRRTRVRRRVRCPSTFARSASTSPTCSSAWVCIPPYPARRSFRGDQCLGPTGRLVVYGFPAAAGPQGRRSLWRGLKALAQTPRFHPLRLMQRNVSVMGVNLGRMEGFEALLRRQLEKIFQLYSEERIRPVIGKGFPLEEAAAAHRHIHARQNVGKVVLTVD